LINKSEFCSKTRIWSKIKILVKNQMFINNLIRHLFCWKFKFFWKIHLNILMFWKIQNFVENSNLCWKFKILLEIQIFVENSNVFFLNSKFWGKFKVLLNIQSLVENSKPCWKFKLLLKTQKFKFLSKLKKNKWKWRYLNVKCFLFSPI